jgi:hypothetical protein
MSFKEKDPWDNCNHTWHDPSDLPIATRGAILTIWEMPKQERIDSFSVKGRRLNLSLDPGRYVIVHNHPANGWQCYVSVDCDAREYAETCRLLKLGKIDGMTSAVTSEGTVHQCTILNCKFVSGSRVEMIRHVRKHNPRIMEDEQSALNITGPTAEESRSVKRQAIKDQIRNLEPIET